MTYYRRVAGLSAALQFGLVIASPALAQSQPPAADGMLGRILDFGYELNWFALLVALGAVAAGFGGYSLWYRFALARDLRAQRLPGSTRLAASGLALVAFASFFTIVDRQFGVAWPMIFFLVGAVLAAIGRAATLAIGIFLALILLVFSRIYGWI